MLRMPIEVRTNIEEKILKQGKQTIPKGQYTTDSQENF